MKLTKTFYNGALISNNFGLSQYCIGNSFVNLQTSVTTPAQPFYPEAKPYGFFGNAEEDTVYMISDGVTFGCFDPRPLPDVAELKAIENRGSSGIASAKRPDKSSPYNQFSYIWVNGSQLKLQTKYIESGSAPINGWGIDASSLPNIPKFIKVYLPNNEGEDYMVLYSDLKTILDSIFKYMNDSQKWQSTHTHSNGNQGNPTGAPLTSPPEDTYYSSGEYDTDAKKMKTLRPVS